MRELGRVRPFGALLHKGKLIAQRRNGALSEFCCDSLHEWMKHSGPCPMRQHVAGARVRRRRKEPGDGMRAIDPQREEFRIYTAHPPAQPAPISAKTT